jgi:hypothetical protein
MYLVNSVYFARYMYFALFTFKAFLLWKVWQGFFESCDVIESQSRFQIQFIKVFVE